MRDKHSNKTGGSSKHRESKGAGTPTTNMAYNYRAQSSELFPTSVQANLRLPTGRPYLVRSREATSSNRTVVDYRNRDVPSVQRIRVYNGIGDALMDEKFSINEWLDYAVQQMYTGLRVSNRSNVGYSVKDLKDYLVQIIELYAFTRAATTHMMCYNMSDPRIPGLQAALCFGMDQDLILQTNQGFSARADDTSYLPVWMRNIQESWSRAKLAADQLATLPIPLRIKTYIDYLFGNVFIDQKVGGQYFKLDLSTDAANHFPWIGEAVKTDVGQYFAESTTSEQLWKRIAQIATGLSGPTATLNTMVSDLRRLEGMVPCSIDIPSDFGTLPSLVVDDELFFDTVDNACTINFAHEFARATELESYNYESMNSSAAEEADLVSPTPDTAEVRVDASNALDDPSRLAMITSLMSVSTDMDGGTLSFGMTPFVYGGMMYVHMDWYDNGLAGDSHEQYLIARGITYGATIQFEPIRANWFGTQLNITSGSTTIGGGNVLAKLDSVLYSAAASPLNVIKLATMDHHPMYAITVMPTTVKNEANSGTHKIGYDTGRTSSFEIIKVLKEGTRVSINALRDIQFYAWASLLRL